MKLLTEPLIRFESLIGIELASLPEVYAALIADRVDCFPALRPHQVPGWHMFLVQLGTIAVQRAGLAEPPVDAPTWRRIIRALTKDEFPDDEPWQLVVEDRSKPAFLQPSVPVGVVLKSESTTPDELDMVITAKNHDVKQAVAIDAKPDDWIFALVSLQTIEGYSGSGNYGIARMNGGSSSRVCLGLAPMSQAASDATAVRPGLRFRRDISQLLARRHELLDRLPNVYPVVEGCALLWTTPWPEGESLDLAALDIMFIEICRRVRMDRRGTGFVARSGTSKKRRVNADQFHGVVGDPWAPVHKSASKTLTLGESGEFDYLKIVEMLSPDWELPLLATLGVGEADAVASWQLVVQAFARGNCKTGGFKERDIPLTGRVARQLEPQRAEIYRLACNQIDEIEKVDKLLRDAIALGAAGGDFNAIDEQYYEKTRPARRRLRNAADRLFFPALWERFEAEEAQDQSRKLELRADFVCQLVAVAERLLDDALADLPCGTVRRPRAEARARARFSQRLCLERSGFSDIFAKTDTASEVGHAT